jgi:cold shock protein
MRNRDKTLDRIRKARAFSRGARQAIGVDTVRKLGAGTGKEFVARLNLEQAKARFGEILKESDVIQDEIIFEPDNLLLSERHVDVRELEKISLFERAFANEKEIVGTIKWFDIRNKFGLIVPDNGWQSVFLLASILLKHGYAGAMEGAKIRCLVIDLSPHLLATQIVSMDNSTAVDSAELSALLRHPIVSVDAESNWVFASVKWFSALRGFGCLELLSEPSKVFCHAQILHRCGISKLIPGQRLHIRWGIGRVGRVVADIRAVV